MKSYAKDFSDPREQHIDDGDFFEEIKDPFIQNCLSTESKLINFKLELMLRFGIDEFEDVENETIFMQAQRFKSYVLRFKHSKSYKKLRLYYERTIAETIECLYLYACAITAKSNKIPLVLKRQFGETEQEYLKFLNDDDDNVVLLKKLIIGLKKDLNETRWVFRSDGGSDFGQTVPLKRSYNYIKKLGLFLFQYSFSQGFTFQVNAM